MSETFILTEPIRVGGEEVEQLTLRKPTVDMLNGTSLKINGEGVMEINADTVMRVFARLANIPPSAVKQISADDYIRMVEVYTRFFGGSRATGETFSEISPGFTTGHQVN